MTSLLNYATCQTSCTTDTIAYYTISGIPITLANASPEFIKTNLPGIATSCSKLTQCMIYCATQFLQNAAIESLESDVTIGPLSALRFAGKVGAVGAAAGVGLVGMQTLSTGLGTAAGLTMIGMTAPLLPFVSVGLGVGMAAGYFSYDYVRSKYSAVWDVRPTHPLVIMKEMPFVREERLETAERHLCPVDFKVRVRQPESLDMAKKKELQQFAIVGREGTINGIEDGEIDIHLDEYGEVALPVEMIEPIIDSNVAIKQALEIKKWNDDEAKRSFPLLYS
mmetsp:Transcript_27684/g.33677  ORF Transcript_27684/g.33677 Transcript_27684/m.33677 type:complete len:280 (-) Transcript_27684:46-885(-)|eukprot:CAMPEP_0172496970 /NCGR_PEP_ID=MMETSP1066-20121228/94721_1 /TAXON_ID=671091 /ORGANISM="Coscinodiscus wailesii, Strain CCMP2513" /LENGTH=279 /DNA_ID=CAMNT_0013269535 /DNA_START=90 /DNA_END=929 /DNA_ORIENTATION=-